MYHWIRRCRLRPMSPCILDIAKYSFSFIRGSRFGHEDSHVAKNRMGWTKLFLLWETECDRSFTLFMSQKQLIIFANHNLF